MLSAESGYGDRFFYLLLDDTDIVTGRHLTKIPKAVEEVCQSLDYTPSAVMICITCVDALLGTDMDRVCRKSSDRAGVPVVHAICMPYKGKASAPYGFSAKIGVFPFETTQEKV